MERRPLVRKSVGQESPPPVAAARQVPPATPAPKDRRREYESFRARIAINRDRLDQAAEEQAQVFVEVCEQHALALSFRDLARDTLSRTDAAVARNERARMQKAGEKATEALINDAVMLHPEHLSAAAAYGQAKTEAEQWSALRDAFDQRMRMIRELVSMYASGYWAVSGAAEPRNVVRDSLAAAAREKLEQDRQARRRS